MIEVEANKKRVKRIMTILEKEYPDARVLLNFSNPLELLIATILAAQCTDERVNIVTPDLFKKYRTAKDYAEANPDELISYIRPTGFYQNKAKSIQACCRRLVSEYGGKVPNKMQDLLTLPGVGRKTANVVLGNAFNIPGIIVDTHVRRLAGLIGLSDKKDPDKIEFDLREIVPQKEWTRFSHLLSFHGRRVCFARRPRCELCKIRELCSYGSKFLAGLKGR